MEEYEACNQPRNQFHKLVRPRSLQVALSWLKVVSAGVADLAAKFGR